MLSSFVSKTNERHKSEMEAAAASVEYHVAALKAAAPLAKQNDWLSRLLMVLGILYAPLFCHVYYGPGEVDATKIAEDFSGAIDTVVHFI